MTTQAQGTPPASTGIRRWRRVAVIAIIVSLSLAALVGIFALLFGTFTEVQGRIMLTTLLIGVVSVLALCDLAGLDRAFRWLSFVGLAAAAVTLVAGLLLIWMDWNTGGDTEILWKTLGIAGTAAVSAAHASLLLLLGRRTNPVVRIGLWVTLALIVVVFGLIAALILTDGDVGSEGYARLLGTVAILDVLGTIIVPVVALFLRDGRAVSPGSPLAASQPPQAVPVPPQPAQAAQVSTTDAAARPASEPSGTRPDGTTPFTVAIPEPVLADLHARLARTRFTQPTPGREPWAAGTDPGYLRDLVQHWNTGFDWRAREQWLNSFPQFLTTIGGQSVHYVHVRGRAVAGGPPPLPLVVSHGWPYSYADMLGLVPFLTDPAANGGSAADAFDLVIPSLPGFGFSSVPETPCTAEAVADTFHRLMTEQLGYPRFGTYGEDVGGSVSDWLAAKYPASVLGLHASHPAYPTPSRRADPTAAETTFYAWLEKHWEEGRAYSAIQTTKPDTLAAALVDSPAGLAAWLVEKFRAWSDSGGNLESRFSKDDLLTTIMLYWVTGSIGTSFRAYHDDRYERELPLITVPAGITVSLADRGMPRELAERTYRDIRFWNELPRGGHFVAKEEPALVADDIRTFFHSLR
ncbi:MAG: putative hydrolase or acyltransferase of alpha/beta superfamily [Cryobacterium sp.]|nr:putative hydrolase or acyltransferase of alpha/beta superfamily [Cryobacterium sp.]